MLRENKAVGNDNPMHDDADASLDAVERRRKRGVRRTAWILGAIAVALFIASLVHGHYMFISHWPS